MNYRISGNYCCLRRPHKGNYTSKFSPAALITKAIILIIAKYTSNFSPAAPKGKYVKKKQRAAGAKKIAVQVHF